MPHTPPGERFLTTATERGFPISHHDALSISNKLGEPSGVSLSMLPSKARSFSADEFVHRVLPLFGGSPQERVLNLMTPEGRRMLNDAYDVVANKQIFTPQVIKELSHYLKGEIPSAEYAWRASPDLLNNTIEELFSRMQGPTTTSFNQALSQQLQSQGKRHILYNPKRWDEYEMLALDPSYVMPLDYRKARPAPIPEYHVGEYPVADRFARTSENCSAHLCSISRARA